MYKYDKIVKIIHFLSKIFAHIKKKAVSLQPKMKNQMDAIHMDDYFYPYPIAGKKIPDESTFLAHARGYDNIKEWRRDYVIPQLYWTSGNELVRQRLFNRTLPSIQGECYYSAKYVLNQPNILL